MRRTFASLLAAAAVASALAFAAAGRETRDGELGGEDKAEIVRLTLERALLKKEIRDYRYIKDLNDIPLSTENVAGVPLPELDGIKLVPLKPEEIQERAEDDGNYVYFLEFSEFRIEGPKVTVTISHYPKYAKRLHPKYAGRPRPTAFGGALIIEYRKRDGKWAGEVVGEIVV